MPIKGISKKKRRETAFNNVIKNLRSIYIDLPPEVNKHYALMVWRRTNPTTYKNIDTIDEKKLENDIMNFYKNDINLTTGCPSKQTSSSKHKADSLVIDIVLKLTNRLEYLETKIDGKLLELSNKVNCLETNFTEMQKNIGDMKAKYDKKHEYIDTVMNIFESTSTVYDNDNIIPIPSDLDMLHNMDPLDINNVVSQICI